MKKEFTVEIVSAGVDVRAHVEFELDGSFDRCQAVIETLTAQITQRLLTAKLQPKVQVHDHPLFADRGGNIGVVPVACGGSCPSFLAGTIGFRVEEPVSELNPIRFCHTCRGPGYHLKGCPGETGYEKITPGPATISRP